MEIKTFADLKEALKRRMAFFDKMGCRASDHALTVAVCQPASQEELERIFQKRLGESLSPGRSWRPSRPDSCALWRRSTSGWLGDAAPLRVQPEQQYADV